MFPDLIVFDEQSFNAMCRNHPGKTVHWLRSTQFSDYLWVQSRGAVDALQSYVEDSPHAVATTQKGLALTDCFTLPQLESHRVVLLSAPAGMGKSTFLTHTPLSKQLLRQALQLPRSAKAKILLDGFDEISPTHQTPALKLLQGLREQGM